MAPGWPIYPQQSEGKLGYKHITRLLKTMQAQNSPINKDDAKQEIKDDTDAGPADHLG